MGSVCCPESKGSVRERDEERSPLLAGDGPRGRTTITNQPQPHSQFGGVNKYTRPYLPQDENMPKHIDILPVSIAEVDKRLQDHAHLFNEHLERWLTLRKELHGLREMFPEHNKDRSLKGVFKHIDEMCRVFGENCLNVKHLDNHRIFLEYDDTRIQHAAIPALMTFNRCSRLVKDILDKGQPLVSSVTMVVENEKEMRRELLVASLGADRPDCMNNCSENIGHLRRVPEYVEYIRKDTLKVSDELHQAASVLKASTNSIV